MVADCLVGCWCCWLVCGCLAVFVFGWFIMFVLNWLLVSLPCLIFDCLLVCFVVVAVFNGALLKWFC